MHNHEHKGGLSPPRLTRTVRLSEFLKLGGDRSAQPADRSAVGVYQIGDRFPGQLLFDHRLVHGESAVPFSAGERPDRVQPPQDRFRLRFELFGQHPQGARGTGDLIQTDTGVRPASSMIAAIGSGL